MLSTRHDSRVGCNRLGDRRGRPDAPELPAARPRAAGRMVSARSRPASAQISASERLPPPTPRS